MKVNEVDTYLMPSFRKASRNLKLSRIFCSSPNGGRTYHMLLPDSSMRHNMIDPPFRLAFSVINQPWMVWTCVPTNGDTFLTYSACATQDHSGFKARLVASQLYIYACHRQTLSTGYWT